MTKAVGSQLLNKLDLSFEDINYLMMIDIRYGYIFFEVHLSDMASMPLLFDFTVV